MQWKASHAPLRATSSRFAVPWWPRATRPGPKVLARCVYLHWTCLISMPVCSPKTFHFMWKQNITESGCLWGCCCSSCISGGKKKYKIKFPARSRPRINENSYTEAHRAISPAPREDLSRVFLTSTTNKLNIEALIFLKGGRDVIFFFSCSRTRKWFLVGLFVFFFPHKKIVF